MEALLKHFKTSPSLSEFIDWITSANGLVFIKDHCKLKLMIDYSPNQYRVQLHLIEHYNNFLKQPLELKHLVPCDKEGKPMEEPDKSKFDLKQGDVSNKEIRRMIESDNEGNNPTYQSIFNSNYKKKLEAYQNALKDCIFEGFEYKEVKYPNEVVCLLRGDKKTIVLDENLKPYDSKIIGDMIGQPITESYFSFLKP